MNQFYIAAADPALPEATALLDELSARLADITGSSGRSSFDLEDVRLPGALFVLARNAAGEAVGCGAFRPMGEGTAEVKRMYAQFAGAGFAILTHLEAAAREFGYHRLRLETRLVNQRAVAFYEKHGYARIPNFGKYAGRTEAVCFEKIIN